eukprot:m.194226 g.194226  ORF g.194226 m.194226 type:complete len:349 (+) comp24997_c0_seq2:376-1422(+)
MSVRPGGGGSVSAGNQELNEASAATTAKAAASSSAYAPATPNPGQTTANSVLFGSKAYSFDERRAIQKHLERPLGGENVLSRAGPGGQKVEYISATKQFEMANLAFSFCGWSTEIRDFTVDFCGQDKKGNWEVGVAVVVKVLLQDGSFHEDVGYGDSKGPSRPMVFGNARKAAVTDATKRALRLFGPAVGLCMGDKDFLRQAKSDKKDAPKKEFKNAVRQNEAYSDAHSAVQVTPGVHHSGAHHPSSAYVTPSRGSAYVTPSRDSTSGGSGGASSAVPLATPNSTTAPAARSAAAVARVESDDDDDDMMALAGEEFESAMMAASELSDDDEGKPAKRQRTSGDAAASI